MTAISETRDHRATVRLVNAYHEQGTPIGLTAASTVALAAVLGAWWIGLIVAALFIAGTVMVALEGRRLRADEFAAISTLHAAAAAVVALSI